MESSETDLHAIDVGEIRRIKQNILEGVEQRKVHKVRLHLSRLKEIEKPMPSSEKTTTQLKERKCSVEPPKTNQDVGRHTPEKPAKDDTHEENTTAAKLDNGQPNNSGTKNIPASSTMKRKKEEQEVTIESKSTQKKENGENEGDDNGNSRALKIANLIHRFRNAPPTNRSTRRKQTLQEIDDMLLSSPCNLKQKTMTGHATKTEKALAFETEEEPQPRVSRNDFEVGSSDVVEQTEEERIIESIVEDKEGDTDGRVKSTYVSNVAENEGEEDHGDSSVIEKEKLVHRWYYIDHNQEDSKNGPFTTKEMFEFIANGVLEPLSPVWCRGLPEWIPLKSVPVLMGKFRKSIGSLGRVSQVLLECPPSPSKPQRPTPPPTRRPYKQSIKTLNTSIDLKNHTRMLEQDIEDENELLKLAIESKVNNDDSSESSDNSKNNASSPESGVLNSEWYQRHIQTVLSEVLSPSDADKAVASGGEETDVVEDEVEQLSSSFDDNDLMATIGINTESVHFESRGTDAMNVSVSTQVETGVDYRNSIITIPPPETIPTPSASLVGSICGDSSKRAPNKATLENPITESLDMLQSLISRVTKEKSILHQKKQNVFCRDGTIVPSDHDDMTKSGKNINDVNSLIKSLINKVETERKRISTLRFDV